MKTKAKNGKATKYSWGWFGTACLIVLICLPAALAGLRQALFSYNYGNPIHLIGSIAIIFGLVTAPFAIKRARRKENLHLAQQLMWLLICAAIASLIFILYYINWAA